MWVGQSFNEYGFSAMLTALALWMAMSVIQLVFYLSTLVLQQLLDGPPWN